MKYRHELKYILNFHDYTLIKARLEALCKRDINIKPEGYYTVRSLYFDDYLNTAYNEKMIGIMNRQKFRIRMYNNSTDYIQLERKIKSDQYILKQTSRLSVDEVCEILNGRYDFLLKSQDQLKMLFYYECVSNLMRPRVVVEYNREPYIADAGELRITFDCNIRAGAMGFDIFDPGMPMIEALNPGSVVLEVKYSDFLPQLFRKILPGKASEHVALSKYVLCCDLTMHNRLFIYND